MAITCRVCASEDSYLYNTQGDHNQYKYYRCRICGLVNYDLSGGVDQEQFAVFYDPEDLSHRGNKYQDQSYAFIKQYADKPGTLMEIGCGNGRILQSARADGWQVKGLELSQYLADSVKNRLDIDVEVLDFMEYEVADDNKYDFIVLRHVFEHIPEAVPTMNKLHSMLNDGGNIEMEFPNVEALDKRVKRFLKRNGLRRKKYSPDYVPAHVNEYCKESFQFLLERTGFSLVCWETYSLKPVLNYIYNKIPIGSKARTIIRKQ